MAVILSLRGKEWVAGMIWETYGTAPNRAALEKNADEYDAPWYALRLNEKVFQSGFCAPVDDIGRPRGIASLAGMLADVRETPWQGVFDLGNGLYWYIAVRDNFAIQPEGDVVGNDSIIEQVRKEHDGWGHWTRVKGDLRTLTALLDEAIERKTKPTYVRSFAVSRIDPKPVLIVGGALLTVGLGCWTAWHLHTTHLQKERQRQFAANQKWRDEQNRVPGTHELLMLQPLPTTWLAGCDRGIASVPPTDHGWVAEYPVCHTAAVTIVWSRQDGATIAQRPPGQLSADGNSVTQTIQLPPFSSAQTFAGVDNGRDYTTASQSLIAWSQKYHVPITIANGTALDPKHPKLHAGTSYDVTINMPISPFAPGNGLDEIPGLRLTSLAAGDAATGGKLAGADGLDPEEPLSSANDTDAADLAGKNGTNKGVATQWLRDVPPFYALKGVLYVR